MKDKIAYKQHWESVFQTKDTRQVSWYQDSPELSLKLIQKYSEPHHPIIDVGGGDSRLPDELLKASYTSVSVLDVSDTALTASQNRLQEKAQLIDWITSDILELKTTQQFRLWHDRAVFHFITEPEEQERYKQQLMQYLHPDGVAVIGSFAANGGAEKCSGLHVARHDKNSIAQLFSPEFSILEEFEAVHITPSGKDQNFYWTILKSNS